LREPRRRSIFRINNTARWAVFSGFPVLGVCAILSAHAGELDGFYGKLESDTSFDKTYSWGIEYREPISDHLNASFVWLNEGHLPNNHRDGQGVQLWWHSQPDPKGLVFEGGIGPYRYYDTHLLGTDPDFEDRHGWGALASASADWYFANHWFTYLRLNQVVAQNKYDTSSIGLGFGYRFATAALGQALAEGGSLPQGPTLWEVDGMLGERIANSAHSETGLAESIEVRRMLGEYLAVTGTFIGGQDTKLDWRAGFAAQLWLQKYLTSRFSVGAGVGAFIVSEDDNVQNASAPSNLAAMISVSIAYSFTPRWIVRATWDRIGTGDDHDADIVLFGLGYGF
jgi:hypothetical protein